MNIQSTQLRPQLALAQSPQAKSQTSEPSAAEPQETFVFSSSDTMGSVVRGAARVGFVAGGVALGAALGGGSGFLTGVGGAALGAIGGGTLGFIGGAASTRLISFDDYGLTNVFAGATIGAVGGLAAGIAAGGFHSGNWAIAGLGLLGAGAGTLAAIQV